MHVHTLICGTGYETPLLCRVLSGHGLEAPTLALMLLLHTALAALVNVLQVSDT